METEIEPCRQGFLKTTIEIPNKWNKATIWTQKYFVLYGPILYHYLADIDSEPEGIISLHKNCIVSDVEQDKNKKRRFFFSITFPSSHDEKEKDKDKNDDILNSTPKKTRKGSKLSDSLMTFISLGAIEMKKTEAIQALQGDNEDRQNDRGREDSPTVRRRSSTVRGRAFSMLGGNDKTDTDVGVVTDTNFTNTREERQIFFACESHSDAELWVDTIVAQLKDLVVDNTHANTPPTPPSMRLSHKSHIGPLRLEEVEDWINSSRWRVWTIRDGVRLFELSHYDDLPSSAGSGSGGHNGFDNGLSSAPSCLRTNIGIVGSAVDIFLTVMNLPATCRSGTLKSMRVVKSINNWTDIVHIVLDPVFLYPTWSAPRDLCLMRYWKHDRLDGSYLVCLDSTSHEDCPLMEGHVRAEMHAVYLIIPPKLGLYGDKDDEEHSECMLTFIAQVDPKGWIWKLFGYQQEVLQKLMMHVLDIRDSLDAERFVQIHFDPAMNRIVMKEAKTVQAEGTDDLTPSDMMMGLIPAPLAGDYWTDLNAATFRVRGPTYLQDRVKTLSVPTIFNLIAIDIFDVPEPTFNVASNPRNRVSLAMDRGEKTWAFVINIMIPGPPFLCFVIYLQGDKSKVEEDTPFGRIAKPFFNGTDDKFRDNRFKMVPKILDGNIILKMVVKDTPSLSGNNLKQRYFKGPNYFELDLDIGSSSVARNIVGLALGYSKSIVVDIGFCLQGNDEEELPEQILGGEGASI
eukprot:CAMPEP_0119051288 /NCGR_PEP_ID=MMETSP1177-20130426/72951_1 /TAXON_ID=2985 /ORGANISM="Ochromonas sp, Strain CCMP1899" /LENGTH=738 /DNA_ID=CAMNT_0007030437 /DNA_START=193 /DNA_END=2410 /DNA_ORIENTATION=-